MMEHSQNAAQCAAACASDAKCSAWTRVAGGRADVQSCYLKSSQSDGTAEASVSMRQLSEVSGCRHSDAQCAGLRFESGVFADACKNVRGEGTIFA